MDAGMIVGVFGIAVATAVAFWQWKPKRLDFEVVTNRRFLADPRYENHDEISVLWYDQRVDSPRLAAVRVENTGRQPIRREDFDSRPVVIEVAEDDAIIMVHELTGCAPSELELDVDFAPDAVRSWQRKLHVQPGLLNPGDWFEIQLVTDRASEGHIKVAARVAGVKSIRDKAAVRAQNEKRALGGAAVLTVGLAAVMFSVGDAAPVVETGSALATGLAVGATLHFAQSMLRRRRDQ